ncbi:site-specific DNA-methyltransferase [Arthrobacter sp. UYEF21]|uniref:site-specific DNA-methyltransferase n=1 Tax=Arthrobacter sp. UYEF21 TaxID=1756364 RepID=UPI00339931BB
MQPTGRLTLSWVGKDGALLNTDSGGYEWVARDDGRATEVRLLDEVDQSGEVANLPSDNLLIVGDSSAAMRSVLKTPEYAAEYQGKVKLVYIDPPFNTGQAFEHYDDSLEHSVWLTMIRDRLLLIRELLSDDGSVWVHLDDAEMAYCRVIMDEVFGRSNFVATVTWEKADSPRNSARQFSSDVDYILIYSKNPDWTPNRLPRTGESDAIYANPDDDPRGLWYPGDPFANKPYSLGTYTIEGPTGRQFSPPKGRYWRVSQEKLESLNAEGRIWWGPKGSARPSIKRYLSEVRDLVPRTHWLKEDVGSNRSSKNEMRRLFQDESSFATPKPERLLQRVLHIGSQEGDIVLDCFAGSGTTAAVAHKMNRRWVTVELEDSTVKTFTKARLDKVVSGTDDVGISETLAWGGGSGFRVLKVAESAYEVSEGRVFLRSWVSGPDFARFVCAQLGFEVDHDGAFAGSKHRTKLAVLDGVADGESVRAILAHLDPRSRAVIVAKAIAPETGTVLKELSPGSRILKAPADLYARKGTK